MGIHQADLYGSKKEQERVDATAIDTFLSGESDLAEGLGLDDEIIDGLRRQALALYESGKWERCIKVVLGLVALGRVHPLDPMLLARSYEKLGMLELAEQFEMHAERIMNGLGLEIVPPDQQEDR